MIRKFDDCEQGVTNYPQVLEAHECGCFPRQGTLEEELGEEEE